jgi:aspartate/methionine/tyrosine aminotransferase
MTIGEPQHAFPTFVPDILNREMANFSRYPNNNGDDVLLQSIADFLARRYGVDQPVDRIMALNGTREGLYNASMAVCPERKNGKTPIILTPNPFYQVYAVAALSVAAEPYYVKATSETGHLPDFAGLPQEVLDRTAIAYICSPANPQGAVADEAYWQALIALAEKHDFMIFADECYSEIYRETPPPGALQVAHQMGADPERVLVFHSLSKRSNLAGLRSGFCAGGPETMRRIRALRAFAGAPVPGPIQAVSAAVWDDEDHVIASRDLYRAKYDVADEVMGNMPGYRSPQAGFFLWLPCTDGEATAQRIWTTTGVRTLPGAYLSHDTRAGNPGRDYIRVALVAPKEDVARGLTLIRDCIHH